MIFLCQLLFRFTIPLIILHKFQFICQGHGCSNGELLEINGLRGSASQPLARVTQISFRSELTAPRPSAHRILKESGMSNADQTESKSGRLSKESGESMNGQENQGKEKGKTLTFIIYY